MIFISVSIEQAALYERLSDEKVAWAINVDRALPRHFVDQGCETSKTLLPAEIINGDDIDGSVSLIKRLIVVSRGTIVRIRNEQLSASILAIN